MVWRRVFHFSRAKTGVNKLCLECRNEVPAFDFLVCPRCGSTPTQETRKKKRAL